jgi:hypothetical protein
MLENDPFLRSYPSPINREPTVKRTAKMEDDGELPLHHHLIKFDAFCNFEKSAPPGTAAEYQQFKFKTASMWRALFVISICFYFLLNRGSIRNTPFHLNNWAFMVNFYIGQVGIMLTMTAFFFRFGLTDQSPLLTRLKLDRALVVQSALDCCAVLMGCGCPCGGATCACTRACACACARARARPRQVDARPLQELQVTDHAARTLVLPVHLIASTRYQYQDQDQHHHRYQYHASLCIYQTTHTKENEIRHHNKRVTSTHMPVHTYID